MVVALKTIIRQNRSQEQLKNVLMSMREHKTTPEEAKWLQHFQWDSLRQMYGESLLEDMLARGLFVFPTHAAEWNHNKTQLLKANENAPIAKISAVDQGRHARNAQVTKLVVYSKLCTCVKVPKLCLHVTLMFRLVCSMVLWA